jgi:sugar phosphate isomerase/epimerase
MKLAYSANAYRKFPILDAIDRIADLGYTGIELMLDRPHAWPPDVTPKQIDAIRNKLDERGLTIANINAFMMVAIESFIHPSWIEPDVRYRRERIEHTKRSLTLAKQLGAPCITTEPGGPVEEGMTREWAMDTFVEELKPVLELAEREGVMLLVEPEPDLLIENSEQFLELASRIDSPAFGHNYDIGHFYCVSENLPGAVDKLSHLTRHYHIEDIADTRVHHHLVPGQGAIDFAEVLRAVRASGYDGWVTVELYPNLDDPDAAGREAKDRLGKILATL